MNKEKETNCATCNIEWVKPFLNHQYDMKHCLWCLMHKDNDEAEEYATLYVLLNNKYEGTQ